MAPGSRILDLMEYKRTVGVSALQFLPPRVTMASLRAASRGCRGCPLYRNATQTVKHFKWVPKGTRRVHQRPSAREIAACLPWLEKEIDLIRPPVLVCLGATAAQALFGREFRVTRDRGRPVPSSLAPSALATVHPSSILRQRTREDRHREMDRFVRDLAIAARLVAGNGTPKRKSAR
jgi:uracil-DNA glycosylase